MSTTLSIKNVPDFIAQNLRIRASRHHRSLQGELMAILEEAIKANPTTPNQILAQVQQTGLKTPAEAVDMIRSDRDDR
jgi:plasmid stability protein